MTTKMAISAIAVALIASTAAFSVQASAQGERVTVTRSQAKAMIINAFNAGFREGLRRNGNVVSSRTVYNRGYNDATNRLVSHSGNAIANGSVRYPGNANSGRYTYASYAGSDAYARYSGPGYNSYARYDGDGYNTYAYNGDINPVGGLLNLIFAPISAVANLTAQNDRWAYCSTRYRTFDPNSGTFLAYDGNRYAC